MGWEYCPIEHLSTAVCLEPHSTAVGPSKGVRMVNVFKEKDTNS